MGENAHPVSAKTFLLKIKSQKHNDPIPAEYILSSFGLGRTVYFSVFQRKALINAP